MVFYFGSHISGDLVEEAKSVKKAGGNLVQIFLHSPEKKKMELKVFKSFLIKNKMKCTIHSLYTHNLARS